MIFVILILWTKKAVIHIQNIIQPLNMRKLSSEGPSFAMKKNHIVFLDWEGTLCWSRFWESLRTGRAREFEWGQKIEEFLFSKDKTLINNWMRGRVNSEQINDFLSEKLQIKKEKLWEVFVNDCRKMQLDYQLRIKIKQLRTRAYVILMTGNMDCFTRYTVPALRLENLFDQIVNSSNVGYLKTERGGESFLEYLRTFNVPIVNTFLVDDSVKTCEFFNSLGGRSYIVRNGKNDTSQFLDDIYHELSPLNP